MESYTAIRLATLLLSLRKNPDNRLDMEKWGFEEEPESCCNTPKCIAGTAVAIYSPEKFVIGDWTPETAQTILGLTIEESTYLFHCWHYWPIPWSANDTRGKQIDSVQSAVDALNNNSWHAGYDEWHAGLLEVSR